MIKNQEQFTIVQVAEYFSCHPNSIRNLIKLGQLHAVKIAGKWLISQSAIDEFMERARIRCVKENGGSA